MTNVRMSVSYCPQIPKWQMSECPCLGLVIQTALNDKCVAERCYCLLQHNLYDNPNTNCMTTELNVSSEPKDSFWVTKPRSVFPSSLYTATHFSVWWNSWCHFNLKHSIRFFPWCHILEKSSLSFFLDLWLLKTFPLVFMLQYLCLSCRRIFLSHPLQRLGNPNGKGWQMWAILDKCTYKQ